MQTLVHRPDLARKVTVFEGYLHPALDEITEKKGNGSIIRSWKDRLRVQVEGPQSAPGDSEAGRSHYEHLLAQALENMHNLRSLKIPLFGRGGWAYKITTQVVAPRVRLESLVITILHAPRRKPQDIERIN